MAPADELLTKVFAQWNARWGTIWSLRSVADAGAQHAEAEIARSNRAYIERFLLDPKSNLIIGDRDAFVKAGHLDTIAERMTYNMIHGALTSVDAASIVFAHSVLDVNASDCLRICAVAGPKDFEPLIERRVVPFTEIQGTGQDAIRDRLIERYLQDMDKESLLDRVDRLHAICQPPASWQPIKGYRFDPERLGKLDTLRQKIVHGEGLSGVIPGIHGDLDFMQKTGQYFISLVNVRYDARIDPSLLVQMMGRGGQEPQVPPS